MSLTLFGARQIGCATHGFYFWKFPNIALKSTDLSCNRAYKFSHRQIVIHDAHSSRIEKLGTCSCLSGLHSPIDDTAAGRLLFISPGIAEMVFARINGANRNGLGHASLSMGRSDRDYTERDWWLCLVPNYTYNHLGSNGDLDYCRLLASPPFQATIKKR